MQKKNDNLIPEPQTQEFNPIPAPQSIPSTNTNINHFRSQSSGNRFSSVGNIQQPSSSVGIIPFQGFSQYTSTNTSHSGKNRVEQGSSITNGPSESIANLKQNNNLFERTKNSINQQFSITSFSNNTNNNNNNNNKNRQEQSLSPISPWPDSISSHIPTREKMLGNFKGFQQSAGRRAEDQIKPNNSNINSSSSIRAIVNNNYMQNNRFGREQQKEQKEIDVRDSLEFFPPNKFLSESNYIGPSHQKEIPNITKRIEFKAPLTQKDALNISYQNSNKKIELQNKNAFNSSGLSQYGSLNNTLNATNTNLITAMALEDQSSLPRDVIFLLSEEENNLAGFRESIEKDKARIHTDFDILIKDFTNLLQQSKYFLL